jgi:hypothetical protein
MQLISENKLKKILHSIVCGKLTGAVEEQSLLV